MKKLVVKKVEIEWADSQQFRQVWWDIHELMEQKCETFKSIGYIIDKNKERVLLAGSLKYQEGKIVHLGTIFEIPTGCIKKIKNI